MFFKYNNKYERITNLGTRTQQPAGDRWQALQGRADQQGSQEHQEGTVELRVRSVDLLELQQALLATGPAAPRVRGRRGVPVDLAHH